MTGVMVGLASGVLLAYMWARHRVMLLSIALLALSVIFIQATIGWGAFLAGGLDAMVQAWNAWIAWIVGG